MCVLNETGAAKPLPLEVLLFDSPWCAPGREERGIAELTGFNADGTRADGGGGGGGGGGDDDDDDDSDDGFSIRTTL